MLPSVNQIEWRPSLYDARVADGHATRGVVLEGYSALRGGSLRDPVVNRVADEVGRTPAQVLVRWHVQHGFVVIPRSSQPDRVRANADVGGFTLSDEQMSALDALGGAADDTDSSADPAAFLAGARRRIGVGSTRWTRSRGLRGDAARGFPARAANGGEPGTTARCPIGEGQTNSQPRTVADMLRLLEVGPGQRVLDVGSGSGWTTALLAHLVGPTGPVLGVELEPSLVTFGSANLAATGQPWAGIRAADPGVLGAAGPRAVRPDPGLRRAGHACPSSWSTSSPTAVGW